MAKTPPFEIDYKEAVVTEARCFDAGPGEPHLAVLRLIVPEGPCDYIITEATANQIIQELRDFLAGDAEDLS